MSPPPLPPELLDHVVDLLHDEMKVLKDCCLVSKSWIPRTRKHIFFHIEFCFSEDLQSWRNVFPDPSTSPAYYTQSLFIRCPSAVTTTDAEDAGWIPTFSRIVRLRMSFAGIGSGGLELPLVPFYRFSPTVKSLHMDFIITAPASQILNLTYAFPLLEDLTVTTSRDGPIDGHDKLPTAQPSNPPAFTGSLKLEGGMHHVANQFLSLQSGLRFRELHLTWKHKGDISATIALVEMCRYTLESLNIVNGLNDSLSSINLTKATKLRDIVVSTSYPDPQWAVATLRTITSNHGNLQRISVEIGRLPLDDYFDRIMRAILKTFLAAWLELDCLLIQLWEAHSIRPKVIYFIPSRSYGRVVRSYVETLLPEATTRGIIDLVERRWEPGW